MPLALDDATTAKSFGHFARVLVDLYSDLKQELRDQILVIPHGYAFFVDLVYEKLLGFCDVYNIVGHMLIEGSFVSFVLFCF